jgi:hypothetical protein
MMPRDLIARADKELVNQMIRRPLAWIPVAMSLAILAMVLTTLDLSGAVRKEDEGTQAHIFQIWLVLEVVLVAGSLRFSISGCSLELSTSGYRFVAPSLGLRTCIGLACPAADRSLVAEDRSAAGVRDQAAF